MKNWSKVPFGDILIESRDGEWGEGENKGGHQLCNMIRGTDFSSLYSSTTELPQRWVKDHLVERKKLLPLDIIFEMAGGTAKQSTGRSAIIKRSIFKNYTEKPLLCASFCRHLRVNQELYSPQFIYYLLQALYNAGYMAVFNIQHTGVSRFQYTSFKKMTNFDVPSLPIQRKIAAVLSAYDDLIENNNRRIALLEKMAEELYREWFVRLRFLGHEKVKIVKGLPEGWEIKRIGEVCKNHDGKRVPLSGLERETMKGTIPYYGAAKIIDYIDKFIFDGKYLLIAEDGSVITSEGYPVLQLINEKFWVNNHTHVLTGISKIYSTEWLYLSLIRYPIIGQVTGAAQPKITQANLNNINILTPPKDILVQFNMAILPIFELITKIKREKNLLTTSRDRLLARLMSGKIDVENLDIQFPASMNEEEVAAHA